MNADGETLYFLRVERIFLNEQLTAALKRIARLRAGALQEYDSEAIEQAASMETVLRLVRRNLRKLNSDSQAGLVTDGLDELPKIHAND